MSFPMVLLILKIMEFKYLNPNKTKILFEYMAYCKYKDANLKNEVTWRCPQCKFVTLKTINSLVIEHSSKNSFKLYSFMFY